MQETRKKGRKAARSEAAAGRRAPAKKSAKSSPNVERETTSAAAPDVVPAGSGRVIPDLASRRVPAEGAVGKYVYCIVQAAKPQTFGKIGLGVEPSDVHTIN